MNLETIRSRCDATATGCWEWRGARKLTGHPYGIAFIGGKCRTMHRVAIVASGSVLGASDCVLHRCDNPPCCNPDHLFVGSQNDNIRDCAQKGRYAFGSGDARRAKPSDMPRGERHCRANFTNQQIVNIRDRVAAKGGIQSEIAREFGVHPATISKIVNRKLWSHVR